MENIYQHLIDHDYCMAVTYDNIMSQINHLNDHNYTLPDYEQFENLEPLDNNQLPVDDQPLYHQKASTYTVLPGVRLNSEFFYDNLHFKYYKNKIQNNKIYLVCENRKNTNSEFCPCTAVISTDRNDNGIKTFSHHNHLPRLLNISVKHLRKILKEVEIKSASLSNSVRQQ